MPGRDRDPLTTFRFHVVVGDISEAAFSECSGLQAEIQVEEYYEGGLNDEVHKLPGRTRFGNVKLLRGISTSDALLKWWKDTLRAQFTRKDVTIILYSPKGEEVTRWTLTEALPVKWVGPTLRASENAVAIETLELAFQGIRYE
jgi:phage tail-like protein